MQRSVFATVMGCMMSIAFVSGLTATTAQAQFWWGGGSNSVYDRQEVAFTKSVS